MKKQVVSIALTALGFLFFTGINHLNAQGLELNAGYPMQINPMSNEGKVKTWANANAGINFNIYIRAVIIKFGVGYQSNNYKVKYSEGITLNDPVSGKVKHNYLYVPFMAYPKLFTDEKNVISIGAGVSIFIPFNSIDANVEYEDGSFRKMDHGRYLVNVKPKIAFRYSRLLGKSFLFHSEVYSETGVLNNFNNNPSHFEVDEIPSYNSYTTIGVSIGIEYILPIDGKPLPRYFQKRLKKTKPTN